MDHPLLHRQIRKFGLSNDGLPNDLDSWMAFLAAVNRAYKQSDQDRELLERSLDLTSMEMRALYDELERHNSQLEREVAARTAELEVANARDRRRMDELEQMVQARTVELRHAAMHDKLTGLPNRSMFYDRLYHVIQRAQRKPQLLFAVIFIDFDRFKDINDSLGHTFGDMLLRAIAQRLRDALRAADSVSRVDATGNLAARLGGDEFCILLEDLKEESDAMTVARRLLHELSRPYELGGRTINSTASIGVTNSTVRYTHAEDMIRDADIAMYRAKHLGRARAIEFNREMHGSAMRKIDIETDIRCAVERGQCRLVYQPIVSLVTGRAVALETLCRWRHPVHGDISPAEFIPLAEELGVVNAIGSWVLETAVGQFAEWRRSWNGNDLSYLTVNISPHQLTAGDLVGQVRDILLRHQLDPASLVLELTETTLSRSPEVAIASIRALRDLGARVFLDDFGSGYSSFGILHEFPLDGIKLDRTFLDSAECTRRAAACIHSVVTLARSLSMDLIAEGIESYEQAALLQSLGCENGQGFLFALPTPSEDVAEVLDNISPAVRRRELMRNILTRN